jgi:hypothetical protein
MTMRRHSAVLLVAAIFATLSTITISAQEGEYGTIPSRFQVTQLGEAAYSLGLDLPEGPGGIRPNLSLEYRHRSVGASAGFRRSRAARARWRRMARRVLCEPANARLDDGVTT